MIRTSEKMLDGALLERVQGEGEGAFQICYRQAVTAGRDQALQLCLSILQCRSSKAETSKDLQECHLCKRLPDIYRMLKGGCGRMRAPG